MAADQDRADRIRALKKEHPETTWDAIGDYVGVSTRAAQAWQETGGITYENAKKLAELWNEDLGYIMRGVRQGTPDLMGSIGGDQLDRIETLLQEVLARIDGVGDSVGRLVSGFVQGAPEDAAAGSPGGNARSSGKKRAAPRKPRARGKRSA